jgi:anthranilate phosphoribosyltransferase
LEGSIDLPRDRTGIVGTGESEHLLLHPRDYGFAAAEMPLTSVSQLLLDMEGVLRGDAGDWLEATVWNGGFYLWQGGLCDCFEAGLAQAREMIMKGEVAARLEQVRGAIGNLAVQQVGVL